MYTGMIQTKNEFREKMEAKKLAAAQAIRKMELEADEKRRKEDREAENERLEERRAFERERWAHEERMVAYASGASMSQSSSTRRPDPFSSGPLNDILGQEDGFSNPYLAN
jgi:predicted PP-loop superfamily ATPase